MSTSSPFIPTGPATAILPSRNQSESPITVIGTEKIRNTFDALCIEQALNSRSAPGVESLVLNPDAHCGYGAPIGCVLTSPTHIYPGPVGVDIKCSMSLLQLNIPADQLADIPLRRALINAILERVPTGPGRGQRSVKKSRRVSPDLGKQLAIHGASPEVCAALGIPPEWADRCEDAFHRGHDNTADALATRLDNLLTAGVLSNFDEKIRQLGSYGGGNHFGEAEAVHILPGQEKIAETFGLQNEKIAFLSHCGSRGFGYQLANNQFKKLQALFQKWETPFPANDKQLVYAPLGTPEADAYIDDMSLGANFATLNHLLINALVLEAFQEILPGTQGNLVYFISHNIARLEPTESVPNRRIGETANRREDMRHDIAVSPIHPIADSSSAPHAWVHRKGATRAPRPQRPACQHAVLRNRPPDSSAGQSASGFRGDGRQRRRSEKRVLRQSRRRSRERAQGGDSRV